MLRLEGTLSAGLREAILLIAKADTVPYGWERFNDDVRRYSCWTVSPRVMFVKIPPGGNIERHRDAPAKGNRVNYVLQSDGADFWLEAAGCYGVTELIEGSAYQFDATKEHWVVNHGDRDCIILVETL